MGNFFTRVSHWWSPEVPRVELKAEKSLEEKEHKREAIEAIQKCVEEQRLLDVKVQQVQDELRARIVVLEQKIQELEQQIRELRQSDSFLVLNEDRHGNNSSVEITVDSQDVADQVPLAAPVPQRSWIHDSIFAPSKPLTGDRAFIFRDDEGIEPAHVSDRGHRGSAFLPHRRDQY